MEIGKKIRYYREQAGFSQKQLANLIYIGERTVGHYETGTRIPPVDKLELIADALDVEVNDLINRNYKDGEAWRNYFLGDSKGSKKNMDEKRFRMMMKRIYDLGENEIQEEGDIIDAIGIQYSQTLANQLLTMTNEFLNFKEIWRYSNGDWYIRGYIVDSHFEIAIEQHENDCYLVIKEPFDWKDRLSLEVKNVAEVIRNWYEKKYSKKLKYSLSSLVYFPNEINDKVYERKIDYADFSERIVNALKKTSINTIGKLLLTSKEELSSIDQLGTRSIMEMEEFKKNAQRWAREQEFHRFCDKEEIMKEKERKKKRNEEIDEFFKKLGWKD